MNDVEYDGSELNDLKLSIGLLTGAWTLRGANPDNKETDKFPAKRYFEGSLDTQARQAIGRLLRNPKPLDSALRYQLAELFDGLAPFSSFDGAPMPRKIEFGNRRAGTPVETRLRYMHLASDYAAYVDGGMPHQKAVNAVCKKYGVSDTTVKEARRKNPSLAPRTAKK